MVAIDRLPHVTRFEAASAGSAQPDTSQCLSPASDTAEAGTRAGAAERLMAGGVRAADEVALHGARWARARSTVN